MGESDTMPLAGGRAYADELYQFDWLIFSDSPDDRNAARLRMMRKLGEFDLVINYQPFGPFLDVLEQCGADCVHFDDASFRSERKHAAEHFSDFLNPLRGCSRFSPPRVFLTPSERRFAAHFLKTRGLHSKDDCLIAVHVGSGERIKRWSPAGYREVVASILESGARVLLLSGPSDYEIVRLVGKGLEKNRISIVEGISIRNMAALIEKTALFFGNDSGLMHLASAVDVPVVSIFGPSDPFIWGPLGMNNVVIYGNCTRRNSAEGCRSCRAYGCLEAITPEDVIPVLQEKIGLLRGSKTYDCGGYCPATVSP